MSSDSTSANESASASARGLEKVLLQAREARRPHSQTPLLHRQFVQTQTTQHAGEGKEGDGSPAECPAPACSLRILQWNILAQGLCRCSDGFVLCPSAALDWSLRQHLILEELAAYSPDILCLQEVDNFSYLSDHLAGAGYKGIFFPKPDSPCLYTSDSHGPDGCALFWNQQKLKLVASDNLVLKKDSSGEPTNQVAIVCRFQHQASQEDGRQQEVVVATTHLKSKCGYHQLRFEQGQYLEKWLRQYYQSYPLVVCGDFNADPGEKVVDVFKASGLGLSSAYTLLSPDGAEPAYTTWKVRSSRRGGQEEFCHTIDYIFYTPESMECLGVLGLPTGQEIGPGRLPCLAYPSDHLALMAEFQITQ